MLFVKKQSQRTFQLLSFWRSEFGIQDIQKTMEYNHYYDYFYCEDPNDFNEIICEPIDTYLKKGFREIDLQLFNRAQSFDFVEVKRLLEAGANSTITFENDDRDSSTFARISNECCYLATCHVVPEFKLFEKNGYCQRFDITRMFGNLLGLAAHEEMYQLLDSYKNGE
jgi:hypothetical protein